jgi:hypothetical protein
MDDYLDHQAQQIDRARTFAEIRRIEERAGKMAQARPEARRRAAWPYLAGVGGLLLHRVLGITPVPRGHDLADRT